LRKLVTILAIHFSLFTSAQYISKVWVADNGDGTYKNPIIHADYSDPDAIRVGDDYYMISSSFNHVPGLPILHSKDLVNWDLIGHALQELVPVQHFRSVQHGNGVWAPSIRYHNNEFYIYYPDPDFGIYLIKSKNITGPWSKPIMVEAGKGLIDPCPLWDDDGKVYLVHAFANSRAGIKSIIVVKQLNNEGTKVISDSVRVYDGHALDPTIEGPKLYKRNGYYYIFAPAGGVKTGWQTVLRSSNVYGPYERKVVMDQGNTPINGPHQGAWVDTKTGEDWFIHFQDKDAYGRVVHLQPMKWINDWPVIGEDKDGDGKGQPVKVYKKPDVGRNWPIVTPGEADGFRFIGMSAQWQWQANTDHGWSDYDGKAMILSSSFLRANENYWNIPDLMMQKFPAEEFTATGVIDPGTGEKVAGLIVFGTDYAHIGVRVTGEKRSIVYSIATNADKGNREEIVWQEDIDSAKTVFLRVRVEKNAICTFSYSTNGNDFREMDRRFTAKPGKWVGAKMGFFNVQLTPKKEFVRIMNFYVYKND
jgi:beta-xylosidase